MLLSQSKYLMICLFLGALTACDKAKVEDSSSYDNTEEVEAYYRDNPERFKFSTIEDLPENLIWQNGSELPVFSDPRAKRGGRLILRLRTMQQTLRVTGPDANGSLREPLSSANTVTPIGRRLHTGNSKGMGP